MSGKEVVVCIGRPWTDLIQDDERERSMLQAFFEQLADGIVEVAKNDQKRPVHFYVWSKNDMTHLIDSCTRAGESMLHSLTELLGCRERCHGPMEQLIFTPIRDEIDQKVVIGYTGHSLAIATSLGWFGFPRFHWTRMIGNEPVDLSRTFRRDIFDFRTSLNLNSKNDWCERNDPDGHPEFFEIRTKFDSGVNAPYWYAMWGILPDVENNRDRTLMDDYRRGGTTALMPSFLKAKCQALRWLEERLTKNNGIVKPPVQMSELKQMDQQFRGRYDLVSACLDFMRLDHHVRKVDFVTSCMRSPSVRVAEGTAIPLKDISDIEFEDGGHVVDGKLDLERFALDPEVFFSVCMIGEESFVRVSPYSGSPDKGQSVQDVLRRGITGRVETLDRENGRFAATPSRPGGTTRTRKVTCSRHCRSTRRSRSRLSKKASPPTSRTGWTTGCRTTGPRRPSDGSTGIAGDTAQENVVQRDDGGMPQRPAVDEGPGTLAGRGAGQGLHRRAGEHRPAVARSARDRQDQHHRGRDTAAASSLRKRNCSWCPPTPTPPWTS